MRNFYININTGRETGAQVELPALTLNFIVLFLHDYSANYETPLPLHQTLVFYHNHQVL